MRPHDDPTALTPARLPHDEQLRQLARILAAGLLRLRRPAPPADSGPNPPPEKLSGILPESP
jgi:hypothetical protein